ncbi:MAG: 30S ribosomal protein S12 methylthiotransferase RimO [bacterium]
MNIALLNLGCPKNQKDGEVALASFIKNGFKYTEALEKAEVIMINTCGFIDEAKQESISTILSCSEYKTNGLCKVIILTGCLSQKYNKDLTKEMPEIDIFLGVSTFPRAYEVYSDFLRTKKSQSLIEEPSFIYTDCDYINVLKKSGYVPETFSYSAYVKVAEGCDSKCTYCSIPSIRGTTKTRTHQSIIDEIAFLVKTGVKEIVLIAQDLTASPIQIKELLKKISRMPKDKRPAWLRLMYCNPWGVDDELIKIIKNEEWIVNYIDMPIQHVSESVLKRMGRRGGGAIVRDLVNKLKENDIVIRSTILTGFPGETAKDFEELRAFVSEGYFNWLGLFVFSPQEGTLAIDMLGKVPLELAIERRNELDRLQFEITTALNDRYVDSVLPVLINCKTEGLIEGRIFSQAPVVDGVVRFEGKIKGPFEKVLIEEVNGFDLIGKIFKEIDHG